MNKWVICGISYLGAACISITERDRENTVDVPLGYYIADRLNGCMHNSNIMGSEKHSG